MPLEEYPPSPIPGVVAPSTVTNSSSRSSSSRKIESPEAKQKRLAVEQAGQNQLDALDGTKLPGSPVDMSDVDAAVNAAAINPAEAQAPISTQERSDRAMANYDRRVAEDPFGGEMKPKTSAEFEADATPVAGLPSGMKGPTTSRAQEDENLQAKADLEAQQAKEKLAAVVAMQRMRAQKEHEFTQNLENARQRYEKDSADTKKPLMEDWSMPRKILMAFAVGLGSAGGGAGSRIFQQAMDQDFQAKKARAAASLEEMQRIGASRGDIAKAAEQYTADILARQGAQMNLLEKQGNVLLARFKPAQQKFNEMIAAKKLELAKMASDAAANVGLTTVDSGSSSARTVTDPGDTKNKSNLTDAESKKAQYGSSIKNAVETIKKSPILDDDDLRQLNNNIMGMRASGESAAKGLAQPAKIRLLRAFGVAPESLTEGIDDPGKKAAALAWLTGTGLIIRDQSGAAITNFEDLNNSQLKMPQPGEGPEAYARKIAGLERDSTTMLRLAGPEAAKRLRGEREIPTATPTKAQDNPAKEEPKPTKRLTSEQAKAIPKEIRRGYERARAVKPSQRTKEMSQLISEVEDLYGK